MDTEELHIDIPIQGISEKQELPYPTFSPQDVHQPSKTYNPQKREKDKSSSGSKKKLYAYNPKN